MTSNRYLSSNKDIELTEIKEQVKQIKDFSLIQDIILDYLGGDVKRCKEIEEDSTNIMTAMWRSVNQPITLLFNGHVTDATVLLKKKMDADSALLSPCTLFGNKINGVLLLKYVAKGNKIAAETIIKLDPTLTKFRGTLWRVDRPMSNISPLEVAWYIDDIEMSKMILSYMQESDKVTAFKQIEEKFPEYKATNYDFTPIISAIRSTDKNNMNKIYNLFQSEISLQIENKGKYYNLQLLLEAWKIFERYKRYWCITQKGDYKNNIIKYLHRSLPIYYRQPDAELFEKMYKYQKLKLDRFKSQETMPLLKK